MTLLKIDSWRGLNTSSPAEMIQDTELQESLNIYMNSLGSLTHRPAAHILIDSSVSPLTFEDKSCEIIGVFITDSVDWIIVRITNNPGGAETFDLWVINGEDNISSLAVFGSVKIPRIGVQYGNRFYFPVLTNGVMRWLGSLASAPVVISGSPDCKAIVTIKDRLFAYNGSTLYYTDVAPAGGLPETWNTGTNFIKFDEGDGQLITAIVPFKDYLLVFKQERVFKLLLDELPSQWIKKLFTTEIGVSNQKAVVVHKSLFYAVAGDGIYVSDGFVFREISTKIRNIFGDRSFDINSTHKDMATIYKDNVVFYVDNEINQGRFFVYRYGEEINGWGEWKFPEAKSKPSEIYKHPGGTIAAPEPPRYIMSTERIPGDSFGEGVWKLRDDRDDDIGYVFGVLMDFTGVNFKTKEFDFNNPTRFKKLNGAWIDFYQKTNLVDDKQLEFEVIWTVDGVDRAPNYYRNHETIAGFTKPQSNWIRIPVGGSFLFRTVSMKLRLIHQLFFMDIVGLSMEVTEGRNTL